MILVTGATGTNGREIIARLKDQGVPFRALARDPEKARVALDKEIAGAGGDIDWARGDYSDLASLEAAMDGAERLFLLTPTTPARLDQERNLLLAAGRAGIRHVVRLSLLGADPASPCRLMAQHGLAERMLQDSGLPCTLLRPHYFMQNLFWYAGGIKAGRFNTAFPRSARHSHVDVRDIARVAVKVLTGSGHAGKIYPVTGPEALSLDAMAAILSEVLWREVAYDDSPEPYRALLAAWGLDAGAIIELDLSVAGGLGGGDRVEDTVEALTGTKATPFRKFAEDFAARFR